MCVCMIFVRLIIFVLFISASASNFSENVLTFDIRDIGRDERIVKAHLDVFKLRPLTYQSPTGLFQVDVIDKRNGAVVAARILNARGGGWRSFDLTDTLKRWHIQQLKDYTVHVRVRGSQNNFHFAGVNSIERRPFLVVHSQSSNWNEGTNSNDPSISERLPKPERSPRNKRGSNGHPCKRKSMIVDTTKIGWNVYVLAPRIFDAYRCEGKCRAYSSQAVKKQTNHAVLQAILSQLGTKYNGRPIRPPCCAPSQFEDKTLLLHRNINGQSIIGLEVFKDMVVKSCACL